MAASTITQIGDALRRGLVCLLLGAVSFACAAVVAGCTDAPNTQLLPIGTRCATDGECGTPPYVCELKSHPGGYCTNACNTDGDCPLDSICSALFCRRKCIDDTTCRSTEGYVCRPTGATAPFCDLPVSSN